MRAKIVKPFAFASLSRINMTADAPSEIELALAAVTVPSFAKAGRNVGIFSILALPGCSSIETTCSPLRLLIVTGDISASNQPCAIALFARFNDSIAKASIPSRVRPYSLATPWVNSPINFPVYASSSPS